MCRLPPALQVHSCMSWGECFLLWLLLPASFLSQFHCGNEASGSRICAACSGTGDTTSVQILLAGLRNSLAILKLTAVPQELSDPCIIQSEENWKLQSCYAWSLSYSNSFIQSLFASVSGDLWIIMFSCITLDNFSHKIQLFIILRTYIKIPRYFVASVT